MSKKTIKAMKQEKNVIISEKKNEKKKNVMKA